MKTHRLALAASLLLGLAAGCESKPRPIAEGNTDGYHGAGWADPAQHGAAAKQGLAGCAVCHGADFDGGSSGVSCNACHGGAGWRDDCTFCHGAPPAGHAAGACGTCHTGYTSSTVNASLHMNGVVDATGGHAPGWVAKDQHGHAANAGGIASCKSCHGADLAACTTCHTTAGHAGWRTECTFCHGTPGLRASPPVDTAGLALRSNVSVGAHEKHATTTLAAAVGCGTCHASRGDVATDAAHMDGGGAAEVALANGTYTRTSATAATCTAYCHGAFPGGNGQAVSWTGTATLTCGSCHPQAPTTGRHPAAFGKHGGFACGVCHGTGYSSTAVTGAAIPTHVNGSVEKAAELNWQSSPKSCDPACHGRESW